MKTLIVHPKDKTTDFLSPIYADLEDKTVITGGITKPEVQKFIESHDRVLMLGHGSPFGLMNPNQFPDAGFYIVDESMVSALKNKSNSIFIWCYANQFVQRHGLEGLNCAMFLSETKEADYYGIDNIEGDLIDQSNERFVSIVSKYINEPLRVLYQKLVFEYYLLAKINPIARFNIERLYFTCSGAKRNTNKMVV
jgi:hypothetical protein